MPSPLGHALGGFAAGWLLAGPPGSSEGAGLMRRRSWLGRLPRRALAFAALGMTADLDLLIGRHSQFTHSIGMTLSITLGAYVFLRLAQRGAHASLGKGARGCELRAAPRGQGGLRARGAGAAPAGSARATPPWLVAVAVGAAYGSHVILDWLAQDATPPRGITALWPFASSYYLSGLDVFWGISREPWRPGAVWHDVLAIAREVMLLAPLAVGAWWLRRPAWRQFLPTAAQADPQKLPRGRQLPADGESR